MDDLYDYAFQEISQVIPNQTPTKSASKQAGDIVLRQITRMEDIKAHRASGGAGGSSRRPAHIRAGRRGAATRTTAARQEPGMGAFRQGSAREDGRGGRQLPCEAGSRARIGNIGPAAPAIKEEEPPARETLKEAAPIAAQEVPQARRVPERVDVDERGAASPSGGAHPETLPLALDPGRRWRAGGADRHGRGGVTAAEQSARGQQAQRPTGIFHEPSTSRVFRARRESIPTEAPTLPVTASPQAASTLPAAIPVATHLLKPADVALSPRTVIYDTNLVGNGAAKAAPRMAIRTRRIDSSARSNKI